MEDKPTVEESLILVSIGANCAARESMLLRCRSSLFSACFNLESQQLEENADWAWCRLEDPGPKAASQCIRIYIYISQWHFQQHVLHENVMERADFAGGSHRGMAASQCVDCGAWFGAPSVAAMAAMALGVVTRGTA